MRRKVIVAIIAFAMVFTIFSVFNVARTAKAQQHPDLQLGGKIYVCNNTNPLKNYPAWKDSTGFAILVNHSGIWRQYPQSGWFSTDEGYYSAVIPYEDKGVNWSTGDEYRVRVDTTTWGYDIKNATSNGTGSYVSSNGTLPNDGEPEFSLYGNESNSIAYWEWFDGKNQTDDFQLWDVITNCTVFLGAPDLVPYDAIADKDIKINSGSHAVQRDANISINITTGQIIYIDTRPSNIGALDGNNFWFGYFDNATGSTSQGVTPFKSLWISSLPTQIVYPTPINSGIKYYTQEGTYYIFLNVDYTDNVDENNTLTLVDEELNNTLIIEVNVYDLPPPPSPALEADHETGVITITWSNVTDEDIVSYNIYWAEAPDGFDFSSPNAYSIASGSQLEFFQQEGVDMADELYYVMRSVDVRGWEGPSSDIVGKYTMEIPPGYSTFSLPLEPFETKPVSWYLEDMDLAFTDAIFVYNESHQRWKPHPRYLPEGIADFPLMLGKTYMIYSKDGKLNYTFVGRPGTTMRYIGMLDNPGTNLDDLRIGTDVGFRTNLSAIADGDDIVLSWVWEDSWNVSAYESLGGEHDTVSYNIYRAESRGDFDFAVPHAQVTDFVRTWRDVNAIGDEYYYLVVPVNIYGREGSSTLAIGVKRVTYREGYSGFGLYLKPLSAMALSGYLDSFDLEDEEILSAIYHFDYITETWIPHPTFLPLGVADPEIAIAEGNLIYLFRSKEYVFIGW